MSVKEIDNFKLNDDEIVKVKEMGRITELMYMQRMNTTCSIIKLSDNEYIDKRTGEVKECNQIDNRSQNLGSIRQSLNRLRDYINTNVKEPKNCKWITLTYAENMTYRERLYKDFEKFVKRARYKLTHFEYIVCMEPHGRGAWHAHLLMIFPSKAPFIPNDTVWQLWSPSGFKQKQIDGIGYDFVKTKKLDDIDNIGAYLTAYLADMPLQEAFDSGCLKGNVKVKEIEVEEDGKKIPKHIVKGARLWMYPPKFNIYRCSRGIKKPTVYHTYESEAQKRVNDHTLTREKTIELDNNDFKNIISYRTYSNKIK